MTNDVILKAENISKQYRLGQVGTGTLSHDFNRWWHSIRGKEDPYLKVGDVNNRATKGESDYVWALKDINFEVKRGEVLGIIGKNGAGKSTLLKILSKVTSPTTGIIRSKGRIASLLEVGTGFNPELTGRENVFLNGAILGMTKKEIASKIDEIIEFSGCERYIDTPTKRYSSGMTVRLAFAVAAFLEPEILVVDEVLAVGDAEFQKKAIGKMQDISREGGRTVLFVSHNMAAVQNLCTRGIVIKNGMISFAGDVKSAVQEYLRDSSNAISLSEVKERKGSGVVKIAAIKAFAAKEDLKPQTGQPLTIQFLLDNPQNFMLDTLRLDFRIDDQMGQRITWLSTSIVHNDVRMVGNLINFTIPRLVLNSGLYYITLHLTYLDQVADWMQNVFSFEVVEGDFYNSSKLVPANQSRVLVDFNIHYD